MTKHFINQDAYEQLLEDLSESIINWQQKEKVRLRDKRFSGKKFLSTMLGYKDPNILWKFLDPGNISKAKLGFIDIDAIINITKDFTPLENYLMTKRSEVK